MYRCSSISREVDQPRVTGAGRSVRCLIKRLDMVFHASGECVTEGKAHGIIGVSTEVFLSGSIHPSR